MALYDYQGNVIAVSGSSDGASPLSGKKVLLIGDSNVEYYAPTHKTYFEETYGCTFSTLATAGATWETANGVGAADTSAVGKVNSLIANADTETKLCTNYDMVLVMMGTNISTVGAVTDTSADVSTMCGAVRYCLEKLAYYYRKSKVGVILPMQQNEANASQLERNDLIQQICEEYSIATLDLNRRGQIIGDNKLGTTSYYLGDGRHLGANGMGQFHQTVGKWMAYEL